MQEQAQKEYEINSPLHIVQEHPLLAVQSHNVAATTLSDAVQLQYNGIEAATTVQFAIHPKNTYILVFRKSFWQYSAP